MNQQITERLLDYVRNRYFGKYRGIVKDNADPSNRGRLKVIVPAVLEDVEVWALPCVPYTGNGTGTFWVPEPDAGVWVEFEAGDCSYPIWTGGFWADDELPKDEKNTTAVPSLRLIRSEKGLMVTMNDDSEIITLSDSDGSNILTIEVQEGKIRLQGNMKVVVEAPMIELVENSTHPVVFGDDLLTYLNQLVSMYQSHTHPGETVMGMPVTPAPPVPPFPSATPALLSTKVKTG
jgi:hypothetical protein